jgi:hypothetical protein
MPTTTQVGRAQHVKGERQVAVAAVEVVAGEVEDAMDRMTRMVMMMAQADGTSEG